MSYSPFLPNEQWPFVHLYNTLFEYFLDSKHCAKHEARFRIGKRKTFLKKLNSDANFAEFWTIIQEQHPEKKDYFSSLTNKKMPFRSDWIRWEYITYLGERAFEELSEEDRKAIEDEFNKLRPAAYQAALRGEALRLKCDISEVRPPCPVLPQITDNDEESLLVRLSDDIFERILPKLDTIDIFRMTLVCRKWKSLICNNSKQLKRVEHAITTHVITFTDWMDPRKTPPCETFLRNYQLFNWSLMRWYCGISTNLETLIVDHPINYTYLAMLLQSCPNLKHLRIARDGMECFPKCEVIHAMVHLRELKVFLCSFSSSRYRLSSVERARYIHPDVLSSSENLQVFRGGLDEEDLFLIESRRHLNSAFNKLIALDLKAMTASALEMLAQIDNLQLRYLKLGELDYRLYNNLAWEGLVDEKKARKALDKLLPKLHQLEVLITSSLTIGITNDTIQLLVNMKSRLSFAFLYHAYLPPESELDEWDFPFDIEPLQPNVLEAFETMLTLNNPEIDLAEIQFAIHEGEILDSLKAVDTGFTIMEWTCDSVEPGSNVELNDPKIQRRLGIEFESVI